MFLQPVETLMSDAAEAFYAHLDVCRQCEAHPFDLCPVGQDLIKATVKDLGLATPLIAVFMRSVQSGRSFTGD